MNPAPLLSLAAALALTGLPASQAEAQEAPANVCDAVNAPLEEGGAAYLQLTCGSRAVVVGRVDSYELIQLPSLDAAVAITSRSGSGSRRAWLVMKDADDSVAIEELTGTIARLGGRGTRRNIDGLEIVFEGLNTGQLTALIRSQGRNAVSLDIAGLVANSRAARGSTQAQSQGGGN